MGELSGTNKVSIESEAPLCRGMQGVPMVPLSPAPADLVLAHTSKPWKTVRSMLGLVGLLFLITNMAPLFLAGLIDADNNNVDFLKGFNSNSEASDGDGKRSSDG